MSAVLDTDEVGFERNDVDDEVPRADYVEAGDHTTVVVVAESSDAMATTSLTLDDSGVAVDVTEDTSSTSLSAGPSPEPSSSPGGLRVSVLCVLCCCVLIALELACINVFVMTFCLHWYAD